MQSMLSSVGVLMEDLPESFATGDGIQPYCHTLVFPSYHWA